MGIYVVVLPPTAVGYIEQRTHRHQRKHRGQCPPIEAGRIIGGSLRAALHLFVHTGGAQEVEVCLAVDVGQFLVAQACIGTAGLAAHAQQAFGDIYHKAVSGGEELLGIIGVCNYVPFKRVGRRVIFVVVAVYIGKSLVEQ